MKLLINEPPVLVQPSLAKTIGLNEAIFLQQLHYWVSSSGHAFDGRRWVYNTTAGWADQFPWWRGEKTIRRIIGSLKEKGLIETTRRYNKKAYDKTLWFSINYQAITALEIQVDNKASGQNDQTASKASGQNDQTNTRDYQRRIFRSAVRVAPHRFAGRSNPRTKSQTRPRPQVDQEEKGGSL